MKGIAALRISAIMVFVCAAFGACEVQEPEQSKLQAMLNNQLWTADTAYARVTSKALEIEAKTAGGAQLNISLKGTLAANYAVNSNSEHTAYFLPSRLATDYRSVGQPESEGTVGVQLINFDDSTVSGTFKLKLYNPVEAKLISFTEGVFTRVSFVPSLGNVADNSMAAKFNDLAWEAVQIVQETTDEQLHVQGISASGETVSLFMPRHLQEQDYYIAPGKAVSASLERAGQFYVAASGVLAVSHIDTENGAVVCTYRFTAYSFPAKTDSIAVSAGTLALIVDK